MRRFVLGMLTCLLWIQVHGQVASDSTQSCDESCCSVDPSPAGIMMAQVHTKNQWMVSYRLMHMSMGAMQQGRQSISNEQVFQNYLMSANNMTMTMHMLMVMYGISDRFTLMGMAQYQSANMHMLMFDASTHQHDGGQKASNQVMANGFADTKWALMYQLLKQKQHKMFGALGVSVPTGSIGFKGSNNSMYPNKTLPYAMQPGSGTFDLSATLGHVFDNDLVSLGTQAQATYRLGTNAKGYKLGNELSVTTWGAYQWANNFSTSLRLDAAILGKMQGYNAEVYAKNEPAADPKNYGGLKTTVYLGSNYFIRSGILRNNKVGIEFGMPFLQNLNGIQMKNKSTLHAMWVYTF